MNAISLYRIARTCYELKIPLVPSLFKWLVFLLYNSIIPPQCSIGKKTRFGHGGIGVVIHPDSLIGDRVLIGQGTTIGGSFGSGAPTIGNDVWIGPGVRVLGDVNVGCNVVIGANAVVTKDVPPNCIVGGIPAKILREIKENSLDVLSGKLDD